MDEISLIVSALAAGAAKAVGESAADAVKEAYATLKVMIARRFAGSKPAETALAEHADDPETWHAPLVKALAASGASADQAIIEAARQLMAALDHSAGYGIDLRGARGVQVGDSNTQTNLFTGG